MSRTQPPIFFKSLESLRGVAALMVALAHCLLVLSVDGMDRMWDVSPGQLPGWRSAVTYVLLMFFNGGAAVTVFFVLSGFVLGLSLDRQTASVPGTIAFYLKRIFRLYPAHMVVLVGVVGSVVLFHDWRDFAAAGDWFGLWYRHPITWEEFFNNLILKENYLNHITWSLQVEIAGSLFLPFAHFVNRRAGLAVNLAVLAVLFALSWLTTYLYVFYLYVFYVGLMLPMITSRLRNLMAGRSGTVLLALGLFLLLTGRSLYGFGNLAAYIASETLGAAIIIAYLLHSANQQRLVGRFLALNLVNRLGRYSYSFYLLHFIILYWLGYAMLSLVDPAILGAAPLAFALLLMAVSVPVTFWLSGLNYRRVEVPAIHAGKRLSAALEERLARRGQAKAAEASQE